MIAVIYLVSPGIRTFGSLNKFVASLVGEMKSKSVHYNKAKQFTKLPSSKISAHNGKSVKSPLFPSRLKNFG